MDFKDQNSDPSISPKHLAIVAGGVLIAVILIIFVVRWTRGGADDSTKLTLKQQQSAIEKTCDGAKDQSECIRSQTAQVAVDSGQVDLCDTLPASEYDGCVWEIADKQDDATLCEKLTDPSNKKLCNDSIVLTQALESSDVQKCANIQDESTRSGCERIAKGPITLENCVDRGEPAEYCEMLIVVDDAQKKQDRRLCDRLASNFQSVCIDLVEIDDPDFDGLETIQETQVYKSDPDKSDTDGDGYKDGDEVAAGFSPTSNL